MNDTITIPRDLFEQIERVMRRLVAKVEPIDNDAKAVRTEATKLMQTVTEIADDGEMQLTQSVVSAGKARRTGVQILLALAEKAEREGWEGPSDLAENHDAYFVQAWEEQEKAKHH
jgi:hypothetical protein